MTILNQLEKVMSDMYAFCNKMYAAIEKSDKDSQIADLVTQADSMDEKFVAEQIVRARNSMDETYRLIEYMNLPVLLDGHLKKENFLKKGYLRNQIQKSAHCLRYLRCI